LAVEIVLHVVTVNFHNSDLKELASISVVM